METLMEHPILILRELKKNRVLKVFTKLQVSKKTTNKSKYHEQIHNWLECDNPSNSQSKDSGTHFPSHEGLSRLLLLKSSSILSDLWILYSRVSTHPIPLSVSVSVWLSVKSSSSNGKSSGRLRNRLSSISSKSPNAPSIPDTKKSNMKTIISFISLLREIMCTPPPPENMGLFEICQFTIQEHNLEKITYSPSPWKPIADTMLNIRRLLSHSVCSFCLEI